MLIEINALEFQRALRAVSIAMSKDTLREHLNSVRIGFDRIDKNSVSLVATDGFWLARWTFAVTDATVTKRSTPEDVLVRASDVKTILGMFGKKPVGNVRVWTNRRAFRYGGHTLHLDKSSMEFPPYDQIMPTLKEHDGFSCVGISGENLTKVSKAYHLAKPGKRQAPMTFSFADTPLDPITVTADDVPQLSAIVMPCRVEVVSRIRKPAAVKAA